MAVSTASSSALGMSGRIWRGGTGFVVRRARAVAVGASPLNRWAPAQRLVEHHPEGVDVGPGVERMAFDLLGREVLGRAHHLAHLGEVGRGLGRLGDAEVGDEQATVGRGEDVPGLHVAVDEAVAVSVVERVGDLGTDGDHPSGRELVLGVEHLAQRRSPHQLHDDGLAVVVVRAGVEQGNDVGVGELGGGHRLLAEPPHEGIVPGQVGQQHLDRHRAGQNGVDGLPHLRHPAGGDEADEPVAPVAECRGVIGQRRRSDGGTIPLQDWRTARPRQHHRTGGGWCRRCTPETARAQDLTMCAGPGRSRPSHGDRRGPRWWRRSHRRGCRRARGGRSTGRGTVRDRVRRRA